MTDREATHIQERILARHLLSAGAWKAASALDRFGGWLLAGFGAAVTLLVGSLAEVSKHLPVATVRTLTVLFLVAAIAGVAQKYLAAVISAAAETSAIAAEAGEKLGVAGVPIDFEVVFAELTQATPRAMRWFVKRSIAAAERGDFAAFGRQLARLSQIQGGLVLVEALIFLAAVALVVCRLGG